MDKTKEAVVWVTSITQYQTPGTQFHLVAMCQVSEIADVTRIIQQRDYYDSVRFCYYHVSNTPQSKSIPATV